MPSSQYNVNILIKAKDSTSGPSKKAAKGLDSLANKAKLVAAGYLALKAAQKSIEFVKFGARVDRAATALDNLAKGAGTSGDAIIKSIQEASGFTIDRMSAMEAANKALLLEVVKTPEEFSELTRNAVLLGRAMGIDAAASVDKFTRAAGRQSKLIADDLGLKVDLIKVQEETNRLMEADASLTEDAAKARGFFNVMMEEAERKTAVLNDEQADAATQIEMLTASWKTLTQNLGEGTAEFLAEKGAIEGASEAIRTQTEMLGLLEQASKRAGGTRVAMGRGVQATIIQAITTTRTWQKDEDELRATLEETNIVIKDVTKATIAASGANWDYGDSTDDAESGVADLGISLGKGSVAYREIARAAEIAARETAAANREFLIGASADFTSFIKVQERDAKDLAEDKEAIEQEHQDKLAAIQKKGRSVAIRLDAEAEEAKLTELKRKLDQAILKRTEVTDKTKQSVINQKDHTIVTLTEQVAAQEQLLDDFHAGRLVKAGQNIGGLLAAEQARYDQEKVLLDESRLEQEQAQKESLGRMVLANFTAWAAINIDAEGEIFKTQLFIQEKYGLITEEGAEMALNLVGDFELIKEVGIDAFKLIKEEQDKIARHIALTFSVREVGRAAAEAEFGAALPEFGGTPSFAHGGTAPNRDIFVGERGVERVRLPAGSQIASNTETRNTIGSNNTYNINGGQAAEAMMARERMERGAAFARGAGM